MDTSALLAKLHIAQMQAQQLSVGVDATIKVPGVTDPVPAKVALISPALDPGSTTVEVWLRLENAKAVSKSGTPVHATISGHAIPNALTVPAEAIQIAPDGTAKLVMVIAPDGTAHKRPVTVGVMTPEAVQILSGVRAVDLVITTGSYGLDDNTKVKIGTDPNAKPDADDAKSAAGDAKPPAGKDADEK